MYECMLLLLNVLVTLGCTQAKYASYSLIFSMFITEMRV